MEGGCVAVFVIFALGAAYVAFRMISHARNQSPPPPPPVQLNSHFSPEELNGLLDNIDKGIFPDMSHQANIPLHDGEVCCFAIFGMLLKSTKSRGNETSEGKMHITTKRLLFVGSDGMTSEWPLKKVIAANSTEMMGMPGYEISATILQGRGFYTPDRGFIRISVALINKILAG